MSKKYHVKSFLLLSIFLSGTAMAGWLQEPGRLFEETVTGKKDHVGGAVADVASDAVDAASRVVQPAEDKMGYNNLLRDSPSRAGVVPDSSGNGAQPSTTVNQEEVNRMRAELQQLKQQKLEQEREMEEQRLREEEEARQREEELERKKQEAAQRAEEEALKQDRARLAQEKKERQQREQLAREEEDKRQMDEMNRKHELKMKAINDLGNLFKALADKNAKN